MKRVSSRAGALVARALYWPVVTPMSRQVDMLLSVNWLWYAYIAFSPPGQSDSSLVVYLRSAGIAARDFGFVCAFFGTAKLYGQLRNDLHLRVALLLADLFVAFLFLGTLLVSNRSVGSLGAILIYALLIVVTLLKTVVQRDEPGR